METKTQIRRYTNLPSLIDILSNMRLTLLDPKSWDDCNDAYFMSRFREKKKYDNLFAMCFSGTSETYHHWRVFSSGSSGVCLVLNRKPLEGLINQNGLLEFKQVRYVNIDVLESNPPAIEDMPFVKRSAFKDEAEFRLIYKSRGAIKLSHHFSIQCNCINRIVLSPWMPKELSDATINLLNKIEGCENVKIFPSSLIENERWKRVGDDIKSIPIKKRK